MLSLAAFSLLTVSVYQPTRSTNAQLVPVYYCRMLDITFYHAQYGSNIEYVAMKKKVLLELAIRLWCAHFGRIQPVYCLSISANTFYKCCVSVSVLL